MADLLKIYKICPRCHGTKAVKATLPGEDETSDVDCTRCDGVGEMEWGRMEETEE